MVRVGPQRHRGKKYILGIIQTKHITYFNCLMDVNFIIVSKVCRVTL